VIENQENTLHQSGSLIYRNARPNDWLLDVVSVRGVQRRWCP